jgi:hypothetical protein
MKHFLTTLLLATLCATGYGQTIKTLGYNTTNNRVVGPTNTNALIFTNAPDFDNGAFFGSDVFIKADGISFGGAERINLEEARFPGEWLFDQPAAWRTNLGLPLPALTNTNATNFRTAIGLGATNSVSFNDLRIDELIIDGENGISFENEDGKANTRSALGLPLPALTNTSNVTMMRALAGSTNDPVTSVVTFKTPSDDSFDMTFSNGILISVEETP